ncbi:MAG: NAD(P)H-hydrate epimerase, partial [Actinomycetes bacterium]
MGAVDREAPEDVSVLVGRAGAGVAAAARQLLRRRSGGVYGRRVVVVAGGGHNGADGRAAAAALVERGARITVMEASDLGPGQRLPDADLVIDAAYGTGFRGHYEAPEPGSTPVLAVDI